METIRKSVITPPPLFLGAVLLFWGWQSDLLLLGAGMGLAVESPRWLRTRLDFSDKDFDRITDISTVLWVLTAIYLFFELSLHGLFTLFKLLPVLFFPLLLAQCFSTQGSISLSSLFLSMRRRRRRTELRPSPALKRIDIGYPFVIWTLISASVSQHAWFFAGLTLFAGWGLWRLRPARYHALLWGAILALGLGLGYAGQAGLQAAQRQMERWLLSWIEYRMWQPRDPYRQHTAIGDIGELKLSNRILMRVAADSPLLLREASYTGYLNGVWRSPQNGRFNGFTFPDDDRHWQLAPPPARTEEQRTTTVTLYPKRGQAVLPLPNGTYAVEVAPGPDLSGNPYGVVKAMEAPGLLRYSAHFGRATPLDSPPEEQDRRLPQKEADFLRAHAAGLGLTLLPADAAVRKLERYFAANFKYSLTLPQSSGHTSVLQDFLERRRAGHCEYFATATALLLRAAGIPTRYAAGYAAEEYSFLQGVYLVRRRHAHAWVLAYVDGRWQVTDTTPADWLEAETEQAAKWWQPAQDLGAWIYYQFARLRWRETDEEGGNQYLLWLIIPLVILLIWRLLRRGRKVRQITPSHANTQWVEKAGADSPFFQITAYLNQRYPRQTGETLHTWLGRLAAGGQVEVAPLYAMLALHNRYRFDPQSLDAAHKARLAAEVTQWLATAEH